MAKEDVKLSALAKVKVGLDLVFAFFRSEKRVFFRLSTKSICTSWRRNWGREENWKRQLQLVEMWKRRVQKIHLSQISLMSWKR